MTEIRCRDCKFYDSRIGLYKGQGLCKHPDRPKEDRPVWGRWTKEFNGCEVFTKGRYKKKLEGM